MKHILSYSFAFIIFLLASCQVSDDDYQHASALRTKEMDLEALKQYMSIDSLANQYTVTITEEQRQKEGISKQNLKEFLRDIDALNKQIHEKVEEGHVVTMYLTTKNNFSTYTIDPHHQLGKIVFSDCRSSSWGHSTMSRIGETSFIEEPQKKTEKQHAVQDNPKDSTGNLDSFDLSAREKQIALLIAEGKTDKEISAELKISPLTVATHNKKIFKKINVHSRVELMQKLR